MNNGDGHFFDFLLPYVLAPKTWPYKEIEGYAPQQFYNVIYQAAFIYKDPRYNQYIDKLNGKSMAGDVCTLIYPKPH